MATLKINIENGYFVSTNGCYVRSVEPTRVIANGWDCVIGEDGTIKCDAVREYSDGEHSIRYVIQPNGFAKLTLKTPYEGVKTLRKGFVTPKGVKLSDGVIGLAGGNIDGRYAYFRDGKFQKWLKEHNIDRVEKGGPNGVIPESRYGNHRFESDGKIEWFNDTPEGNHEIVSHEECRDAKWIIVYDIDDSSGGFWISSRDVSHRVLRTLENPMSLDIPEKRLW